MNNRQPPRRGRGRNNNNNNRPTNNRNGGSDRDNRIDSRARGNAAQMLDKYKKMAQDAQVNGDRVTAEYYLQFADHYFRVNADAMARREEQRLAREDQRTISYDRDNDGNDSDEPRDNRQPRGRRPQEDRQASERQPNERQSSERQTRDRQTAERQPEAYDLNDNAQSDGDDAVAETAEKKQPVRTRRPRKVAAKSNDAVESNSLDASVLPPAISVGDKSVEVEKKPVRKKRVVKAKPAAEAADQDDAA